MFAFDDQFDGGVADLLFGVVTVAYGNQVVAVAFDKAFGAVFTWFEAFYNSLFFSNQPRHCRNASANNTRSAQHTARLEPPYR